MRCQLLAPFVICLMLAGCAMPASDEDVQMANALCAQGKTLLASGKNAEARDVYASATNRDDENARAWNGLGVAYDMMGKRNDALEAYQRAVELMPQDLSAVNNLAHLYIEMGDPQKAFALLAPYGNDPNTPLVVRQNLATARQAALTKQTAESETYAELGSYPTEGMAQGRMAEIRSLLDDKNVRIAIEPEVRISGGTPSFTIKATGRSPESICDDMNAQAFPCVPHEKPADAD